MQESSAFPPNAFEATLILVFTAHTPESFARSLGTSVCVVTPVRAPHPPCTPILSTSTSSFRTFHLPQLNQTCSSLTTSHESCGRRGRPSSAGAGTRHCPSQNSRLS